MQAHAGQTMINVLALGPKRAIAVSIEMRTHGWMLLSSILVDLN